MLRPRRLLVYLAVQRSEKFELSALGCSPTVVGRPAIVRAVSSADQPRIIIDFISFRRPRPPASAFPARARLLARLVPRGARQRSSIVRPLSLPWAKFATFHGTRAESPRNFLFDMYGFRPLQSYLRQGFLSQVSKER